MTARLKLQAVRIPARLRGFPAADAEVFDVTLAGAQVEAIAPSLQPARGTLLSALVDAHAHIDKNYTVREAEIGRASCKERV